MSSHTQTFMPFLSMDLSILFLSRDFNNRWIALFADERRYDSTRFEITIESGTSIIDGEYPRAKWNAIILDDPCIIYVTRDALFIEVSSEVSSLPLFSFLSTFLNVPLFLSTLPFLWEDWDGRGCNVIPCLSKNCLMNDLQNSRLALKRWELHDSKSKCF